jgi:tetratricopeptide (TPR) repeat protein
MEATIQRAIELRNASKHTEAMAILLDLAKKHPRDPRVNYLLAGTYDTQGMEAEAIPYYERALDNGLSGDELRGCLLGLGSSYRCRERYADAVRTLERGIEHFPDAEEFRVFLAMAYYNMGLNREAVSILLKHIGEYSANDGAKKYQRAILYYAKQPDPPYEES